MTSLTEEILRPETDPSSYRMLTLSSGLRVVLRSCASETNMTVSACVSAGAVEDPEDFSGVARVVRMAAVYGSTRYPATAQGDGGLAQYAQYRGAHLTTKTSSSMTRFSIDMHSDAWREVFPRLVDALASPTLSPADLISSVAAAVSEGHGSSTSVNALIALVDADSCNKLSSYNRRMHVNSEALLTPAGFDAIREFHQKHYVASAIVISLSSRASLDEMERFVLPHCAHIPIGEPRLPRDIAPPMLPGIHLGKYVHVNVSTEVDMLSLSWLSPFSPEQLRTKPHRYIARLLTSGWLPTYLRRNGLATAVTVNRDLEPEMSFVVLSFSVLLTARGATCVPQIIGIVIGFLSFVRDAFESDCCILKDCAVDGVSSDMASVSLGNETTECALPVSIVRDSGRLERDGDITEEHDISAEHQCNAISKHFAHQWRMIWEEMHVFDSFNLAHRVSAAHAEIDNGVRLYGFKDALVGPSCVLEYSPDDILSMLNVVCDPDMMRVIIVSARDLPSASPLEEPVHGTNYCVSETTVAQSLQMLHPLGRILPYELPRPSGVSGPSVQPAYYLDSQEYAYTPIPAAEQPQRIFNNESLTLWYSASVESINRVYLLIQSAHAQSGTEGLVLRTLWARLLEHVVMIDMIDAALGTVDVEVVAAGLEISIEAPGDSLPRMLASVAENIARIPSDFYTDADILETLKELERTKLSVSVAHKMNPHKGVDSAIMILYDGTPDVAEYKECEESVFASLNLQASQPETRRLSIYEMVCPPAVPTGKRHTFTNPSSPDECVPERPVTAQQGTPIGSSGIRGAQRMRSSARKPNRDRTAVTLDLNVVAELRALGDAIFREARITAICIGMLPAERVVASFNDFADALRQAHLFLPAVQMAKYNSVPIPAGPMHILYEQTLPGERHRLTFILQLSADSTGTHMPYAAAALFLASGADAMRHYLRKSIPSLRKCQLQPIDISGVPALVITVDHTGSHIDAHDAVEAYITEQISVISNFNEQTFALLKESVVDALTVTLSSRDAAMHYWDAICAGRNDFDRRQKLADAVRVLSLRQLNIFLKVYVAKGGQRRRALAVHAWSVGDMNPVTQGYAVGNFSYAGAAVLRSRVALRALFRLALNSPETGTALTPTARFEVHR